MKSYRISWLGDTLDSLQVLDTQEVDASSLGEAVDIALIVYRRCREERYLNERVSKASGFHVEPWSTY